MRGKEESKLIAKFHKKITWLFPKAFWYKIPDSPGGPLRPFDVVLILNGTIYCLEFKSQKGKVSLHQKYYLSWAKLNLGIPKVVRPSNMNNILMELEEKHGSTQ